MAYTSLWTIVAAGLLSLGSGLLAQGTARMLLVDGAGHTLAPAEHSLVGWGTNGVGQLTPPQGLTRLVAIACGHAHTLALQADGTVAAWGANTSGPGFNTNFGQTLVPSGLDNVVAIAAGDYHSLALKQDGTVVGFGRTSAGALSMPAGLSDVVAIAAGQHHSLTLTRAGKVQSWGYPGIPSRAAFAVPDNLPADLVAVAAGGYHSMVLTSDGTVRAWGSNDYGQLGADGATNIKAIAAGQVHSVALTRDGKVKVWGTAWAGINRLPVVLANGSVRAKAIRAGTSHSMAITESGEVIAWGYGFHRQTTVPAGLSHVLDLSGGNIHSVALTVTRPTLDFGQTLCGSTSQGLVVEARSVGALPLAISKVELVGMDADQFSVTETAALHYVVTHKPQRRGKHLAQLWLYSNDPSQSASRLTLSAECLAPALEVRDDAGWTLRSGMGVVTAWGRNDFGQCDVPPDLAGVTDIAAGWGHSVALVGKDKVVAWGINDHGRQSTVPVDVTGAQLIAAGGDSTAALLGQPGVSNRVRAWGYNGFGQTDVPALTQGVEALALGYDHVLALLADGSLLSWGKLSQNSLPLALGPVAAIAAGGDHSMALLDSGRVRVWGNNDFGQHRVPATLTQATAVAAGRYHCLALRPNGKVVAWGNNLDGQCNVPSGLADVVALSGGNEHSVALRKDHRVVTWQRGGEETHEVPADAIAAGGFHTLSLRKGLELGHVLSGQGQRYDIQIKNVGTAPLRVLSAVVNRELPGVTTQDSEFSVDVSTQPISPGHGTGLHVYFYPKVGGPVKATLRFTTNDPDQPVFEIPLLGTTDAMTAVPMAQDSSLGYGPGRVDRNTGLVVQDFTCRPPAGYAFDHGLKLEISGLPTGVTVLGASAAEQPGVVEAFITQPIAADQNLRFSLTYVDPLRRTHLRHRVSASPLPARLPDLLLGSGPLVTLRRVHTLATGNLLEFESLPQAVYQVEYSSDRVRWVAATHLLLARNQRTMWMDRGQPETQSTPVPAPHSRHYRVRRFK